jgi:hypothetical protein
MSTVFFSFPFEPHFDAVFEKVGAIATRHGSDILRADEHANPGSSISAAILRGIRECHLVIADITGNNPNVLNEVGLAQAYEKPLILITQESPEIAPFNIRHLGIIRYDNADLRKLEGVLDKAFTATTTPSEILRAMLVPGTLGRPTMDSRFVIAASPLAYRRIMGRHGGYEKFRRTSSDYVGVRGILQSFGLLFGSETPPDILDPEDCNDSVLEERMNLYCIASPKANRWTRILLEELAKRWVPCLQFRADPESHDLRNIAVSIFCNGQPVYPAGWDAVSAGDRYWRDFGIIVRGPNPYAKDHMATVIAGRSSLGTEAACMAFTDLKAVAEIQQQLGGLKIDLENHEQPFLVMVSMKRAGEGTEEAIRSSLEIEHVAAIKEKR